MSLIIAIAFLFKRYGTQAVPLPTPTPTSSAFEAHIFARDNSFDGCHSRAILDILWSCLATTFACTWVSVHPNVPFRGEGLWTVLRRRIFLMFFSILAPEFMILWAFKQWRGAMKIRDIINAATVEKAPPDLQNPNKRRWTTTHGHFLQMGGFRLSVTQRENFSFRAERPVVPGEAVKYRYFSMYKNDKKISWQHSADLIPEQFFFRRETQGGAWNNDYTRTGELTENIWEGVLTIDTLETLLSENLIRFPTITEDEINDKSKGDALSKGIALLQLTWFIIQIITRAAQGLAITEIELTTAALAGLNSVMYIFWWSKPLGVCFPVDIRTKAVEELLAKRTAEDAKWSFPGRDLDFRKHPKSSTSTANGSESVEPKPTSEMGSSNSPAGADPEPHSGDVNMSRMQKIYMPLLSAATAAVNCFVFLFSPLAYVINSVLFIPVAQILHNDGREGAFLPMLFDADRQVRAFSIMLYSKNTKIMPLLSTASIAGVLFGGVHCLAWHFSFPSHTEQIMWRAASLGIAGTCALSVVGTSPYVDGIDNDYFNLLWLVVFSASAVVYPVSRLMLIVLAIMSLRSLPPSAFDTVQWVEFVPHI